MGPGDGWLLVSIFWTGAGAGAEGVGGARFSAAGGGADGLAGTEAAGVRGGEFGGAGGAIGGGPDCESWAGADPSVVPGGCENKTASPKSATTSATIEKGFPTRSSRKAPERC